MYNNNNNNNNIFISSVRSISIIKWLFFARQKPTIKLNPHAEMTISKTHLYIIIILWDIEPATICYDVHRMSWNRKYWTLRQSNALFVCSERGPYNNCCFSKKTRRTEPRKNYHILRRHALLPVVQLTVVLTFTGNNAVNTKPQAPFLQAVYHLYTYFV